MRVPLGLFNSLSMITTALLSKRRYEPSLRTIRLAGADNHRVMHLSSLFHLPVGRGDLDMHLDHVADPRGA